MFNLLNEVKQCMKFNKLICSMLLIVFFTKRFWGIEVPWFVCPVLALIGILFIIIMKRGKIKFGAVVKYNLRFMIIPIILNISYSFFVWFLKGFPEKDVIRNLFTSNLYLVIYIVFSVSMYIMFGKKAIDIAFGSACISYVIGSVFAIIVKFGVGASLKYLLTSIVNQPELLYTMEVHDLTFAFGIFFLYYYFYCEKGKKRNYYIAISAVMIFWGLKRIEIAALLICILFAHFVLNKYRLELSNAIMSIFIMVASYIYIMCIHTSFITDIAQKYNIDFMGRLGTYFYIASTYSEFSPSFMGHGVGFIDEIIDQLIFREFKIGYAVIIPLHSDTLRMYIGLGFIGFGCWIIYQTFIRPKLMKKVFQKTTVYLYLLITLYLFILYLTDNTYLFALTNFVVDLALLCGSDLQCIWRKDEKQV